MHNFYTNRVRCLCAAVFQLGNLYHRNEIDREMDDVVRVWVWVCLSIVDHNRFSLRPNAKQSTCIKCSTKRDTVYAQFLSVCNLPFSHSDSSDAFHISHLCWFLIAHVSACDRQHIFHNSLQPKTKNFTAHLQYDLSALVLVCKCDFHSVWFSNRKFFFSFATCAVINQSSSCSAPSVTITTLTFCCGSKSDFLLANLQLKLIKCSILANI